MTPELWEAVKTGGAPAVLMLWLASMLSRRIVTGAELAAMTARCERFEALVLENVSLAARMARILERDDAERQERAWRERQERT